MNKVNLALTMMLTLTTVLSGQNLTGEEIIQKVNDLFNPQASYGKGKMTIVTTSGDKRTFVYESWAKDRGEKTLMRYQEPRRVKGQAVLMLNHSDDIWMYFPRTQRVRKMATHAKKQKMQGSDFSYEDMGSGDSFIKEYNSKRLEDEKMEKIDCYRLELTRKPDSDMTYSRVLMWVIKENFFPVVLDYFNEHDPGLWEKRLVQSDIRIIDDIPTAMKATMINKRDNTQTEMELIEMKYDVELSDDMFTERDLKK